jgi:hypothetical protein
VAPPFSYQFTYTTTNQGGITISEGGRQVAKINRGHDAAVATTTLNSAGCAADSKLF